MKIALRSFVLLAFLAGGYDPGGYDPSEVTISMKGGVRISGEILAVRDSAVVFTTSAGASDNELASGAREVRVLPYTQIAFVQTVGSSHTVIGLFSGMAIGCLGGYAIGGAQPVSKNEFGCSDPVERSDNQMTGALVGTLVGGVLGMIIGSAVKTDQDILITPGQRDFSVLKFVARFPQQEPSYLKQFVR